MTFGTLEVVCGPMFSGKTKALIERVRIWEEVENRTVCVLKPAIDTRYSNGLIVTHSGQTMPATIVGRRDAVRPQATHIAVDEAQFISNDNVRELLDFLKLGRHLVFAGLDLNSSGEPFGPMPMLLAHADIVTKLRGKCARCDAPSTRSQNLTTNTAEILVGGAECYEPRCARCFTPVGL
jgi:thymidine kinase